MVGTAEVRASDVDRERVAAQLARAHAEVRLTLTEYDERVRAAHGAVVMADLGPLTADLPADPPADSPRPAVASSGGRARGARRSPLRAAVTVWAAVSVVNLVIWLAVSLGVGAPVAPWWIWVAGPWGLALGLHALTRRAVGCGTAFPRR